MVPHARGTVLAADSIAGLIWQVDPKARTIKPWLKDRGLTQDPAAKEFRPGANGLKREGDRLIVSNSSRGTLSTIRVGRDGAPVGSLAVVSQVGAIDDFAVGRRGEIVFTTHGAKLMRLARDDAVTALLDTGCDGCTAVAIVRHPNRNAALIVLTTGGLAEGDKEPARVLRLPYDDRPWGNRR